MAITAASQHCSDIPQSATELCAKFACDINKEECMTGECTQCPNQPTIFGGIHDDILSKPVEWQKWDDIDGHNKIVTENGSLLELLEYILQLLPSFKVHSLVQRSQQKYFHDSRNTISEHEAVLQVDFAENYAAKVQDELQMLHWAHQQVTIFTAVAWLKSATYSFAVISDDLSHGKHAVWVFLSKICTELLKLQPGVTSVKVFSDGCTAQFKNKFTLTNLTFMKDDFGCSGEWSFFASSHGKGAVDGVGGTVKRTVWNAVRTRNSVVTNAEEFAKCAERKLKNVRVIYVPACTIEASESMLDARWEQVKSIKGTQRLHYFKPTRHYVLEVKSVSQSERSTLVHLSTAEAKCEADEKGNRVKKAISNAKSVPTKKKRAASPSPPPSDISDESIASPTEDVELQPAEVEYQQPNNENLFPGSHILVSFKGGKRQASTYKYVCTVGKVDDDEGEITVTGLRCTNDNRTQFAVVENDISSIEFSQIIGVLPSPNLKKVGRNIVFEFPGSVDVWERP